MATSAAAAAGVPAAKGRVLIAGAGPVGLAAAALLGRFGVPSLVLERAKGLPNHPQAHFLNCRTMELLRHAFRPRLGRRVASLVPDLRHWRHFIYTTAVLGGVEIGRVDHFHPGASASAPHRLLARASPVGVAHLSQKRLMPLLYDEVLQADDAAPAATAEVRFGWEVEGFEAVAADDPGAGIRITARDRGSGASEAFEGRFLLAADGASSRLRKLAGVEMVGATGLQHLMNVHFSSAALAAATKARPAMLYFIYNKDVVCVLVAHHFQSGEFVMQLPYFPPVQEPADFDEPAVRRLLDAALGQPLPDLAVHSVRPWTMDCQVAQQYRCGPHGNLLLVGDAAHRFPPAGGFGMNTGMQDAHNLAWKLALVMRGLAGNALLDTYEAERRPVAAHNAVLSLRNFERSLRVPEALGLDAEQAKLLAESAVATGMPMPKPVFEGLLALGRRPLRSLESSGQPYGMVCLKEARRVLADGAGLPLLFPHDDLGFCYTPDDEGPREEEEEENPSAPATAEIVQDLGALTVGARMPHFPLALAASEAEETEEGEGEGEPLLLMSTTDLPDQLHVACRGGGPKAAPFAVLLVRARDLGAADGGPASSSSYLQWDAGAIPLVCVELVSRPAAAADSLQVTAVAATLPEESRAALCQQLATGGKVRMVDVTGAVGRAMDAAECTGVLLRPDGHLFALVRGREDLRALFGQQAT